MNCIISQSLDLYYNLALEEYLLKGSDDEYFVVYRNDNSIVVGKHQITNAEINNTFVRVNDIKVGRRISGGGAVYHDSGNINYSFILNRRNDETIDFKSIANQLISALQHFGISPEIEGKNNIVLNGKKFSGNSSHIFRNRVIHHGTLLFNANLDHLKNALTPNNTKYIHKKVHSIPGHVMNLSDVIKTMSNSNEFTSRFFNIFSEMSQNSVYYINDTDDMKIRQLAEEKYSTPDWIYSYQGDYEFANTFELNGQNHNIYLKVAAGRICDVKLEFPTFNQSHIDKFSERILNCYHRFNEIMYIVNEFNYFDLSEPDKMLLATEFL